MHNNEYLKDYCDNEGTERAVERLNFDLIEDEETKRLFIRANRLMEELDSALYAINKHLGLQE